MSLVPTVRDLSFYSDQAKQAARYDVVKHSFSERFGAPPQFYTRAPGRVNLIGEHIDYCHFSVLPMAIEADVIAATAATAAKKITIANMDPKFATAEIELPESNSADIAINKDHPSWVDYFKCGLVVARKYMLDEGRGNLAKSGNLQGFNVLFDGKVPTGGGLSSSAAFCIAATLSVLAVNGVTEITKSDLTKITVVCEHYVGLSNGGMDQSASINGEENKVLLVSFFPKLSAMPFALPATDPETVFLISNSLVTANKTETAPSNYNLRVVEVSIAAEILCRELDMEVVHNSNVGTATLRGVLDAYFTQKLGEQPWDGSDIETGIARLQKMLAIVEKIYTEEEKDGISVETAMAKTGKSRADFGATFLAHFPTKFTKLNVYRRTRHVYSDSLRVLQTLQLAKRYSEQNTEANPDRFLGELGALMDDSQVSTRDFNQASTVECDELCALGRAHGSYGSRVTGAGFGGCVVHVTTVAKLAGLTAALTDGYYKKRFAGISDAELAEALVVSKPAMGACIVEL